MKTIFGADNVTVTDATADHGKLIDVNLSAEALPAPEAYLFLMKDGETGMMIGCEKGRFPNFRMWHLHPATASRGRLLSRASMMAGITSLMTEKRLRAETIGGEYGDSLHRPQ